MHRCSALMRKCWIPFAIFMITIAIVFSLFRALTPWAKQYKGEVEQHLSTLLGQPVVISSMETSWYWFEPVLKLNQVTVSDRKDQVLTLNKLMVGINLFSSLWNWHIQPGILYVDDVHLTLHQIDDSWEIDGLRHDEPIPKLDADAYLPVLGWLLGQQKIVVKNLSALVHLNNGTLLPVTGLNLTAVNNNGRYRLKAMAKLAQTTPTSLLVFADLKLDPNALNKGSGHAYFSLHNFLPMQWQGFFPKSSYHLEGGKGNFEVWLDVLKGQVSGVQTKFNFRRIAWNKDGNPKSQFIQFLGANLAWNHTPGGWRLSGDQIKLRADGVRWPVNSLQVNYQQSQQNYRIFIKDLLLEPILAKDIEWPEIMQPVLAVHPRGRLQDTQIGFQHGQVNYVLSRFSDLSWQGQGAFPAVNNISGALNWQPTGGRLELDGEDTTLTPKGLPPVNFAQANAAFEWKELSHGLRISMERLVLSHPDFIFSARGALDEPFEPASRHLQVTGEFSADNAAKWLAYIPSQYLKPKLDHWLKHAIKRVDKVSGELTINGALADFPFDKQPGEFSIASRVTGMDLLFHKKWPIIRDIDTNITLNKRTLDFDVLHANLSGILASQANLRIDDLGMDKETLLLHGKVDVPASILKHYILTSPVKTHLSKLEKLDLSGLLGLDLRLEIPLYPQNDEVLALGAITFNDNEATFHHVLNDVVVSHLSGLLEFNEHGIIDSKLNARLLGDPVAIHLQSVSVPQPSTLVNIEGDTTIDLLREKFDLPLLSFMEGHLSVAGQLTLTDNPNDLDHMQISTPLKGVGIDLPAPLGKVSEEAAPLTIDVDFNPDKALRMRFNYDNRLSSDFWFTGTKGTFALKNGTVQVGNVPVRWNKRPGIQVAGSVPMFNYKAWQDALVKLPQDLTSPKLLDSLQFVDMKFGGIAIWGQKYQKVGIRANRLDKGAWSILLEQRDIAGDLRYQQASNTLSGRFPRLYLNKSILSKQENNNSASTLKPMDLPNLNLTIDAFKLGEVDLGNAAIKSTSTNAQWHLDYFNIKSPTYQLAMKGDWLQRDGKNTTDLQANLHIGKLEDILESWHITPVLGAHKGDMQFIGGWPGAINDFSLAKANGHVYIELNDGRISNLSKEVEEKLGMGKLLSILSLQTIPRRLKLDFSDLSQNGYSFDTFKGNFILKKGVMRTADSYIDGPVAYASIKGDFDVVRQLYDVDLHVSPHITASLPVVATIAGGPIAGIATWVASKIINQGMQTVTGYTYKVSGPWRKPVVQQVNIFKKKTQG